jgi:hypothetical protein
MAMGPESESAQKHSGIVTFIHRYFDKEKDEYLPLGHYLFPHTSIETYSVSLIFFFLPKEVPEPR